MEPFNKLFVEFLISHDIPFELEIDNKINIDQSYLLPFELEIRKEFPNFKLYPPDLQQQQATGE